MVKPMHEPTVIALDDELAAHAAQELGTGTKKETVSTALREVLANARQALALIRLRAAAVAGEFDLDLLECKRDCRRRVRTLPDRHQCAARFLRTDAEQQDQAATAGLIATRPSYRAGVLLQRPLRRGPCARYRGDATAVRHGARR